MDSTDTMEKIYTAHSKMVFGFLLSKCGDADLAEELTQETFYQAVKSINSFRSQSAVSTWLCGIAANVWRSYLKKHRGLKEIPLEEIHDTCQAPTVPSAENQAFINSDVVGLMKTIHCLKEPLREVVYLRLMGSLSFGDIGLIMGRTENWARVNFYRGKEKILEGVKEIEKK